MSKEYIEREKVIEVIKNYGKNAIDIGQNSLDPVDDILLLQGAVGVIPAAGVIVPPCNVGDIVYVKYSGAIEYFVISKVIHNGSNSFDFEADLENEDGYTIASIEFGTVEIGRTVFLTKEEAEQALAERNVDNA